MNIKKYCKRVLEKLDLLDKIRSIRQNYNKRKRLTKRYKFENRKKDKEKVCIILAGYQELVWELVFKRIKLFIPKDIDVCICSSGKYSEKLSQIAKRNEWSYLSTKRNNLALIQNVAIDLFKKAKYIYKLDEDIFITKGYFETLMKTLKEVESNAEYDLGVIAPTIPVNGYGHVNVIKRFDLEEKYKKLQEKLGVKEKLRYVTERGSFNHTNPKFALFLWKEAPNIDQMNYIVQHDEFGYDVCPIRFSIGAILFKRELWEDMGLFDVLKGTGLGNDEMKLNIYCLKKCRPIMVSRNSIVGHLAYGPQKIEMEEFYKNNKKVFDIH